MSGKFRNHFNPVFSSGHGHTQTHVRTLDTLDINPDTGVRSPDPGTSRGTAVPSSTPVCLMCSSAIGPGSREIVVRSTSDRQLAWVHEDCLREWIRKGPPQ